MTLPNYGIPQQTEAGQALQQTIQANGERMYSVAMPLALALQEATDTNSAALKTIQSAARRKLGGMVGANTRRLNTVIGALSEPEPSAGTLSLSPSIASPVSPQQPVGVQCGRWIHCSQHPGYYLTAANTADGKCCPERITYCSVSQSGTDVMFVYSGPYATIKEAEIAFQEETAKCHGKPLDSGVGGSVVGGHCQGPNTNAQPGCRGIAACYTDRSGNIDVDFRSIVPGFDQAAWFAGLVSLSQPGTRPNQFWSGGYSADPLQFQSQLADLRQQGIAACGGSTLGSGDGTTTSSTTATLGNGTLGASAGSSCDNPLFISLCLGSTSGDTCSTTSSASGYLSSGGSGLTGYGNSTANGNTVVVQSQQQLTPSRLPFGPEGQAKPAASLPTVCTSVNEQWIPGTAAWCLGSDNLTQIISGVGQQLQQTLSGIDLNNIDLLSLAKWVLSAFGPFGTALGNALSGLCNIGISLPLNQVVLALKTLLSSAGCFSDPTYLALITCRKILDSIQRIRVGIDPGIWATTDIDLNVREVGKIVDYLIAMRCPLEIPGPGDALEAWVRGYIDEPTACCWTQAHGLYWQTAKTLSQLRSENLTWDQLQLYAYREGKDRDWIAAKAKNLGIQDDGTLDALLTIRWQLPTVGDFLHFLQRNVFDDEYVNHYHLLDGFDDRFWAKFGDDLQSIGMNQQVAQLHYAAHWINPSPTEMREFVYRLRQGKPGVANPFTIDDYKRLLAEQDVAPFMQARFADTIYRVPALGYIRDMYRQNVFDDAALAGYHQDLGYTEQDSVRFVQVDKLIKTRMRTSESHGWTPSAISNAFGSGILPRARAVALMAGQGWNAEETDAMLERAQADFATYFRRQGRRAAISSIKAVAQQALSAGAMSVQDAANMFQNGGMDQQSAELLATSLNERAQIKLITQTVSGIKSAYMSGRIDAETALSLITQAGIQQDRANSYMTLWALQHTDKVRRRTTGEIVSDIANGMMTVEEALTRLHNLKYPVEDAMLFIADARRKILSAEAKQASAEERLVIRQENEIAKAKKEAEAAQKSALEALSRIASPSKLQRWAKKGIITKDFFFSHMAALEFDPKSIERYWNDACTAKGSACQPDTIPS